MPLLPQMVGLRFQGGGPGCRRRAGDRPLRPGEAGVGADEPGRVDDRRDARRELEAGGGASDRLASGAGESPGLVDAPCEFPPGLACRPRPE